MPFSDDGVPYGSIDMSELDSVEPKTDEAKAAIEALKAQRDAGNKEADQAAEDSLKAAESQSKPVPEGKGTTSQSSPVGDPNPPAKKQSESKSESEKKG